MGTTLPRFLARPRRKSPRIGAYDNNQLQLDDIQVPRPAKYSTYYIITHELSTKDQVCPSKILCTINSLSYEELVTFTYRDGLKGGPVLLSKRQAEISCNLGPP